MSHRLHLDRQQGIIDQAVAILAREPAVIAVAVSGSHARGQADAFSDIDLICYLDDPDKSRRPGLCAAIAGIAPLLCHLWVWERNALFLYENGVRLDVDIHPPGDLTVPGWNKRCRILHDPAGRLAAAIAAMPTFAEATQRPWDRVDWLFWMFRQIVCWTRRGEQDGGERSYDKLNAAVDALAQVRSRLHSMRICITGRNDYLERVDPAMAARLAQTFPSLRADDIQRCTGLLLDELERIGPEFCRWEGTVFPAAGCVAIRQMIAAFNALPLHP